MLNNNAIETLAVNAICNAVVCSPHLDEHISKRDKEPSVDGFVTLYKSGEKTKDNIYGRVAVQIKGTRRKISQTSNKAKFSVEISDLHFYQKEGGIIYFYVWLSEDGQQNRVFYNELLPVKINRILSVVQGQSTVTLKFKALTNTEDMERLFFAFYNEKRKQSYDFVDLPQLPSIDDLQKNNVLSNLTLSVLNIEGYRDHVQAILNNDVYMYAGIKGSQFLVPLGILDDTAKKTVIREDCNSISAGNVVYDKVFIHKTICTICINIEDWFSITLHKTHNRIENQVDLKFVLRKTLRERVKDSEFLIAFFDIGGFYHGENFCDLQAKVSNISNNSFDIELVKTQLGFMKKLIRLFDILHIDENLDMTALSEHDLRELETLTCAFVDQKPVSHIKVGSQFNYYVQIGNLLLALYQHEKEGNRYIGDIFSANLTYVFDTDGKRHLVPAYAMLDKEGWSRISNIDYSSVFPTFKHFFEQNKDTALFNVVNNTLLSILLAFDQTQKRQLLELAIELSRWILDESHQADLGQEIPLLNYYQSIARKNDLEKSDRQKLTAIAENMNIDECIRVGAYLLLRIQIAAEMHFCNFDMKTQEEFRSWPIYHFWSPDTA